MADTGKILLDHFLSEREKDTFIPELSLVALDRARAMGYGAVFLGGDPKLYGRFGFEPSYKYGINHVKGIRNRAYMGLYQVLTDYIMVFCVVILWDS